MQTGLQITREALIAKLNNLFYQEVENARYCGDFAVRGSVVDVVCGKNGIRIDFFGNQIESIKAFDTTTQKSIKTINNTEILPVSEIIATIFSAFLTSLYSFKIIFTVFFGKTNDISSNLFLQNKLRINF